MGYDLKPTNKKIESISFGAFFWPIILQETGMGYVIGYGEGREPATYVYRTGNKGSPASNDGFNVSSTEAKAMAMVARGFVLVQRFIAKSWEEIPEQERERQKAIKNHDGTKPLYKTAWHEDRLKLIEKFAEFAEQSKGFSIR